MKISFPIKFICTIFICINFLTASAQDVIDEDFLDNIELNAKDLWAEALPAFNVTVVPEKYKNESAVIFGYKRSVTIDKKSRIGFLSKGERSLNFFENVHFKIKLNDRNAVKAFTEIYFRYNDKTDGFSTKIIKANGTVKQASLNDAVSVEASNDVPEFFKSFFDQQTGGGRRYYKVAVPDLEPGDILEYVTVTKSKQIVTNTGYVEFDPQYEICNKNYPILFNQIIIETDEKSFFKSLSLNGAPEFKKETATDPEFFKYVFTDYDRPVEKDVNYINSYQVYPLTKFQVIYSNREKVKGALIGEVGEIKKAFTKEELAKKAWEDYEKVGDYTFSSNYYGISVSVQGTINQLWAEFKKRGAKNWTDKEFIKNTYYRIRNIVVNRDNYLSDKVAAYMFGSMLFQRDIKSELIIGVSNTVGKVSNVLFENEIRFAVKVDKDIYFNFTDHSVPGDLVENLLGSEAYIIEEPVKKTGAQVIKPFTFPDATFNDNTSEYSINATLQADMNTLLVTKKNTYTGINKDRNITTALKYTPYILYDYKYYGGDDPTEKMRASEVEEYNKSVKFFKDEYKTKKEELVKEELQREFQQKVKYKNFDLESDGRSDEHKKLTYTEEFELYGLLRKAGKKYLINLAGLMGSQLQIKKDERERKLDINVGYARTILWTINLKIPDGYTVDGLKEMNVNIDNETGTYICTAEEANNTVILKMKKVYKKANNTKDKWPAMLQFIDGAYNTSYKYILLKPKN
jgi:Domain of Unknown Function with PDB structure (DUF3857)